MSHGVRELPFTAWPRLWTWRLAPEVVIGLFIAIYAFGTGIVISWVYYVEIAVLVALAIGWPLWLKSRTLAALPDAVRYRPFFGVARTIAYERVRELRVDRKVSGSAHATALIEYVLCIVEVDGHQIKVLMDVYRIDDLHVIAQEIRRHAPHARIAGLAPRLIDGSGAFVRMYIS
jgi:hypothetical protein